MTKVAGSGSKIRVTAISQRLGSADPDPDPHQNFKDPEHWFFLLLVFLIHVDDDAREYEYICMYCVNTSN